MPSPKQPLPYGLWPSAITPALIGAGLRLNDVQWVPGADALVWSQSLSGKTSLIYQPLGQASSDLTGELNPSGGVGYGGGDFAAGAQGVVFAEKNGRLYFRPYGAGSPRPITPAFGKLASPAISPDGRWVLFVHSYEDKDVLGLVPSDGSRWPSILSQGADFYMQPAWSPAGTALAWVEWNHPNMPWDGAELKFALFNSVLGQLDEVHTLDGGGEIPVFQPSFSPDGKKLAYLRNAGEWDQLLILHLESGEKQVLVADKALLPPAWVQGERAFAWTPDSRSLIYLENQNALTSAQIISVAGGSPQALDCGPYTTLSQPSMSAGGSLACIAESPQLPARIITCKDGYAHTVVLSQPDSLFPEDLPTPLAVSWPSSDGTQVFGTYYAPSSRRFYADGAPPMIVYIHGGPTSQTPVGYSADTAFFTNRGYAYLVVNYRGSTGYGRSYREALYGRWGEVDLIDAVEGAQAMVTRGLADPGKLVIKGGSAGGYTVLNALVRHPGFFKAGLCSYGVSNLFTMDLDTHKFEAHYNKKLVGELPAAAENYRAWSPIFHAGLIRDALAIFQGTDDRVVPQDQSDSIVAVLAANKVPHIYHLYECEGHGFRKTESINDFYQSIDRFLKQYVIFS